MSLRLVLRWLTRIIVLAAALSTTYLYLYPLWFGCAFPSTTSSTYHGFKQTIARHAGYPPALNDSNVAPFRLLVLADPQLEGDSSLPDPEDAFLPRLKAHGLQIWQTPLNALSAALVRAAKELVSEDIPRSIQATRKTLDLFGNDYYLAHVYRTLHWWSYPTHVTVLGDLIGSQWVNDEEFQWRAWRYWNRVFADSKKPSDEIMNSHMTDEDGRKASHLLRPNSKDDWENTIINAVGNHDIGYAGDISQTRVERFEQAFGKVNWDIHFTYPYERLPPSYLTTPQPVPTLHLVVLNSMLLDTPAFDSTLQSATYDYINNLIVNRLQPVESRNSTFTLLLTHVPLHKPEGTCVDAPFFDYWSYTDADGAFDYGGLKEQNHLSEHASHAGILQSIFGMSGDFDAAAGGRGRNGLVLTGHDHQGCDVVHYINKTTRSFTSEHNAEEKYDAEADSVTDPNTTKSFTSWSWNSVRTKSYPPPTDSTSESKSEIITSLREITLRSMMGEFGGNAGLLSMWYDFDVQTWKYEMQLCPLGVQHVWWAVHVVDVVAVLSLAGWVIEWVVGSGMLAGKDRRNGGDDTVKVNGEIDKKRLVNGSGSRRADGEVDGKTTVNGNESKDENREIDSRSRVTVLRDGSSSSVLRSTSQRRRKG